ncbi:kappa-type opioid receptor-like [Ptychodera flava]|uniref:kappa-type opioid receptor-like n=1 Tax=Ptychodera flava TaxID=63121 RepID=UPI00396A9A9A
MWTSKVCARGHLQTMPSSEYGNTTLNSFGGLGTSANDTSQYVDGYCSLDYNVVYYCRASLSAIAFFGNISFMFVVLRVRGMRTLPNVHFINLAAADSLVIVTELANFTLYRLMVDGYLSAENLSFVQEVFPKVWIFVIPSFLCTALLTITLISVERYIAVCHPFKANLFHLRSRRRVVVLIATTWVLGASMGTFALFAEHNVTDCATLICWLILFALFTAFPIVVVVTCYGLVVSNVIILRHPRGGRNQRKLRSSRSNKEERNVLILCVAITLLFLICFAPLAATQTISVYMIISQNSPVEASTLACMQTTQSILLLIHLAASPLLYNCGSRIRRKAFRSAFSVGECSKCGNFSDFNSDNGNDFRVKTFGGFQRGSLRLTTAVSECNV